MRLHDPVHAPELARSPERTRPAVSIAEDSPDARLVFFRIAPGQRVATHASASSVVLVVMAGSGFVSGSDGEREVRAGMIAAIDPREPHGMRSGAEELVLAAVIAPRPGTP